MRSFFLYITIVVVFSINNHGLSQVAKPKVALVLSGGGAKGLAHIPVLQTLDSLGIVPDLVVGTSMGSIVGGLYAMGYTGDSIVDLASNANWDYILGGKMAFNEVSIEEKSEYGRYMAEFALKKWKPEFPKTFISDQNLREFLSKLCFPAYQINDFDSLPIPFRAVAVDIVNGKEVVIKDGSINTAMRSSMAIPSVFEMVKYEDVLLVDGGVTNNFPTDIAKQLGADIIIGSDVGGGMISKEKLEESVVALLFQTGMIISNLKNPENRKLCDIMIDHVPHMQYSSGDFNKANTIYNQGKIARDSVLAELVKLSKKLNEYDQANVSLPKSDESLTFDTVIVDGVSEGNLDMVFYRTNIRGKTPMTIDSLILGIDQVMGTTIFNKVNFDYFNDEGLHGLSLSFDEKAPGTFKTSIHYDGGRGLGVIFNVTGRNILGKASRSLVTLDIAEQPRFRVQHQKYFSKKRYWWWRSEAYGTQLDQNIFLEGQRTDELRYRYFVFDNQVNKSINLLQNYIGFGLRYDLTNARPKINPELSDNVASLERYHFNNVEISSHFVHNNLDKVFYPKGGSRVRVMVGRTLYNHANIRRTVDSIPDQVGTVNGHTKVSFLYHQRLKFRNWASGMFRVASGFSILDKLQNDEISVLESGYGIGYYLGGNIVRPRRDNIEFPGLRDSQLTVTQYMMLNIGVQFNPYSTIYLTPHFNIASVGHNNFDDYIKEAFNPPGKWTDLNTTAGILSGGFEIGYMSALGPFLVDFTWINELTELRIFFSAGFHFNRSD